MDAGQSAAVRRACAQFLDEASKFYKVPDCSIRVPCSKPIRGRKLQRGRGGGLAALRRPAVCLTVQRYSASQNDNINKRQNSRHTHPCVIAAKLF
jgi:hypothetical protein